jgi:subtilisin
MTGDLASALTWNHLGPGIDDIRIDIDRRGRVTREWAWGGATGAGIRVCIVDSGIEGGHPQIGAVASAHAVVQSDGVPQVVAAEPTDAYGHGTACASIVRRVAPECRIHSLRVLGPNGGGSGGALRAGLAWAIAQGFEVINLSLSTASPQFNQSLRELADEAYFRRSVIIASAHNSRVESFPWRFSSVISVGSHGEDDPALVLYNPAPPVEFFARGQGVPVAGLGGTATRNTGNSFATPHITGLSALILSKHPGLTTFELKTVLYLTAANVKGAGA